MEKALLQARDIKKNFGHVQALRGVELSAYRGEILAIVGDNGAGKSTFIKILSGSIRPDQGSIVIDGQAHSYFTPREAIAAGISTVYQDLALANTRNVSANIFLGQELTSLGFLNKKDMEKKARALIDRLGIDIPDLSVPVGVLSGGQRQGTAVARLMRQGGKLFIFDEPTAAMGLKESKAVLKLIKKLAQEGYGVILISHDLPQVFQISDRIAVFRQGKVAALMETSDCTMDQVIGLITGTEPPQELKGSRRQ